MRRRRKTAYGTIIVGAGVFGLASAWKIAQGGGSVVVIERDGVGTQASGFALGRIDPLMGGIGSKYRVGKSGDATVEGAEAVARLGLTGHGRLLECIDEIERVAGLDLQLDQQSTLQMIHSEEQRAELLEQSARWREIGFHSEFLTQAEVRVLEPRAAVPAGGGLLIDGPFFLDSLRYAQGLAACAEQAGAEIRSGEVVSIRHSSDGVDVTTRSGNRLSGGRLVIAAGPWTAEVAAQAGLDLPIFPSKGEIIRLSPLESGPLAVHLHGPSSLVQKRDGHIWAAATAADSGFDRTPTTGARDTLLANARSMLPEAEKCSIVMHTVCFRPVSRDGLPIIGPAPGLDNAWIATGGGGSGIMQSIAVGEIISAMVAGVAPGIDTSEFRAERFQSTLPK